MIAHSLQFEGPYRSTCVIIILSSRLLNFEGLFIFNFNLLDFFRLGSGEGEDSRNESESSSGITKVTFFIPGKVGNGF